MNNQAEFIYSKYVVQIPLLLVFVMWFVYWFEIQFDLNFTELGVLPRKPIGLRGIFFSPFIHSGTKHLVNNSIPVLVFVGMLYYFYKNLATRVLFFGGLLTGFLTWLIGAPAYHIGMSGIVYLLFGFLFFSGIIRRHLRLIAVSLIVIFLYGGMFWYVFPIEFGISWEGHLSGLFSGFLFSVIFRKKGPQQKAYVYKKDEFDLLFDEEGNFNPPKPSLENSEAENSTED